MIPARETEDRWEIARTEYAVEDGDAVNEKPPLKKLDPRGRRRLNRGELEGPIEALIRTERTPSPEEEASLRRVGWRTRSAVAHVLSGTVAGPRELEELIRLPFIRQVELSRPLHEEPEVPAEEEHHGTASD